MFLFYGVYDTVYCLLHMYSELIILFILGTILGSFINALAFRHNTGKSMWGRSGCITCGMALKSQDLVPVVSFLFLRGRCRGCGARISWQYPIVEVLGGVIAVLAYTQTNNPIHFTLSMGFFMVLLFIAVYDLRHTIIPDQFVVALVVSALLFHSISETGGFSLPDPGYLFSGIILALPLVLIWLLSKGRAMGLGDGKLMFAIGFFLGISQGASAFLLSFWIGAVVGILLLLSARTHKKGRQVTMKSEVPFGPFLVLGAGIAYFFDVTFFSLLSFF